MKPAPEAVCSADAVGATVIDLGTLEKSVDRAAVRHDTDGDQHYDVISAFIKSVRGSDVDVVKKFIIVNQSVSCSPAICLAQESA